MNLVILKGNITRAVEVTYTPKGNAVCEIGIAINKTWTDSQTGEKKEKVSFHDCRAWGRTAEFIEKYFSKGKPILIQGELSQDEWEDKETGKKRRKTLVLIERVEFAGDVRKREAPEEPEDRGGERSAGTPARSGGGQSAEKSLRAPVASAESCKGGMEEDDIPF